MRLIDKDALLAEYDRVHVGEPGNARKLIENAPTVEERKTGKWVGVKEYCDHLNEEAEREGKGNRYMPSGMNISVYCNKCWKPNDRRTTYCPNCGKRMVQEGEKDGLH